MQMRECVISKLERGERFSAADTGRGRKHGCSPVWLAATLALVLLPASVVGAEDVAGRDEPALATDALMTIRGQGTPEEQGTGGSDREEEALLLDMPGLDAIDLPPPEEFLVDLPETPPPRPAIGEDALTRIRQGFSGIREENFELAERMFREALDLAPGEPMARLGLSTALLSLRAYEEAETLLQVLIQEFPDDYAVLNNRAWLYATSRDVRFRDGDRAVRYARKALLQNPSSHHVWSTLAQAHFIRGAYEQAVRAAEQALHLAREADVDERTLEERRRLLERTRQAARAFEILD